MNLTKDEVEFLKDCIACYRSYLDKTDLDGIPFIIRSFRIKMRDQAIETLMDKLDQLS